MREAFRLGAKQAAQLIERSELRAEALIASCRERIAEREPTVKAWTHLAAEWPAAKAPRAPLYGVPVGVKDIFDTHDMPTQYGSPIYAGYRPRTDAAAVALTRRAGGTIMGKTVTAEFATFVAREHGRRARAARRFPRPAGEPYRDPLVRGRPQPRRRVHPLSREARPRPAPAVRRRLRARPARICASAIACGRMPRAICRSAWRLRCAARARGHQRGAEGSRLDGRRGDERRVDAAAHALRRRAGGEERERHAARHAGDRTHRRRCAHARLRRVDRRAARMSVRVAIPDLVSPSYFPAIAAVELGFLPHATIELLYPVTKTYEQLREGQLDFVGGAAHAVLYAFKDWQGAKLLCALAQRMYWFLVVHKNFKPQRGQLAVLKGLRIGAAPGPVDGLKQMLRRAGISDVQIGPVPGVVDEKASFGLMAAKALAEGKVDGFWANGMGAEVAVREGVGTVVLDARRDGSPEVKGYTFPALVCTDKTIRERPQVALAAIQAVRAAHQALKEDPERATAIGKRLFPPTEAALIAELIRRDSPYYQHGISRQTVDSMNRFAQDLGLLSQPVTYDQVVWTPD